jgi:inner membrane protein involved in colicin E2 resistance
VGLYETPVYTAHVQITGEFLNRDFADRLQEKEGREVKWNEARLLVLNSESRALRAVDDLVVAGESLPVSADGYAGSAGISAAVPAAALRENTSIPFRLKLTLAGSSQLTFLPLARRADISLKSTVAASEVRRRAGAARTEHRQGRFQRAMVGAGNQSQLRPKLV